MVSALFGMSPLIQIADLGAALSQKIAAIERRDLDREFQLAAAQAGLDLIGRGNIGLPAPEARAFEALQELPALERAALIKHREAQMLDIERDAVAEREHKEHGAEQREGDAHRIAHDFHGFASRDGPYAGER